MDDITLYHLDEDIIYPKPNTMDKAKFEKKANMVLKSSETIPQAMYDLGEHCTLPPYAIKLILESVFIEGAALGIKHIYK